MAFKRVIIRRVGPLSWLLDPRAIMSRLFKILLCAVCSLLSMSCASSRRIADGWEYVAVKGTVIAFESKTDQIRNSATGTSHWYDSARISVEGPFSSKCKVFSILHQEHPVVNGKEIYISEKLSFKALMFTPDENEELFCHAFISELKDFESRAGI